MAKNVDIRSFDGIRTFEALREALFRYYDTPFGLADRSLQNERRELLNRDGGAWRRPLIELRPRYVSSGMSVAASASAAGAPPEFAELASLGLVSGVEELYKHQHDALAAAVGAGKDVVITAGTGSGKTESFMLPVLASLVEESSTWTGTPAPHTDRWWSGYNDEFCAQRHGEQGRPAAVRALVLYPMNALVDDQMMRMRRALDSDAARDWFARHRKGHRFYFGRYTGATPVPGDLPQPGKRGGQALKNLRSYLRATDARNSRARVDGDNGKAAFFVPRLDGAEMRSRWDMLLNPPDILVTNYSMLNVMLLRPRESRMFDLTRKWLEENPDVKFTLIVDELHMYRGTAGTEIAYLIRALRHRLGLDTQPDRLQILAASASLDEDRDRAFLGQFFGVDSDRFTILPGETVKPSSNALDLTPYAHRFASLPHNPPEEVADTLLRESKAADALCNCLADEDGHPVAKTDDKIASHLFSGVDDKEKALRGLLSALRWSSDPNMVKLRVHLFFRNITGMWACSNPECSGVDIRSGDRRVGRLYSEPATRCAFCNARVLELLYCQTCGDVFLGGYFPEAEEAAARFDAGLLADHSELDRLPDRGGDGPSAANYVVYWPRHDKKPELSDTRWRRSANGISASFTWQRSVYTPQTGRLENSRDGYTGWSFHVAVGRDAPRGLLAKLPAYPSQCIACGDDVELQKVKGGRSLPLTDPSRLRPAVRTMRTGFEKFNQVLTDELLAWLPEGQRGLVVFSDSRADAAKLASGLGLRHYQDLLRFLLFRLVTSDGDRSADLDIIKKRYTTSDWRMEEVKAAKQRMAERGLKGPVTELSLLWSEMAETDVPDPEQEEQERLLVAKVLATPSIQAHISELETQLLALGVNPGGPAASLRKADKRHTNVADAEEKPWTSLYDWTTTPPERWSVLQLDGGQQDLRERIDAKLREETLYGLYSGAGRDFESLGLGWLAPVDDLQGADVSPTSDSALVRSTLRVLGHARRFTGLRHGQEDPPKKVRDFWAKVAEQHGLDPDHVADRARAALRNILVEWLIKPDTVGLRPAEGRSWTCERCQRRHLHPGTLTCTKCYAALPAKPEPFRIGDAEADYYTWQASRDLEPIRLHTAELTGQTDRIDAQARQARFQQVFLEDSENELADAVDLLSVTTTMEAGVDIGALTAVNMSNMPPTRFNYQQRVGRAGRRGSPIAVALTVCRGRSHDDYYFARPELITNEPTPKPYLAMDMAAVFQRVLAAEVMRAAFSDNSVVLVDNKLAATINVHGQFGLARDWQTIRPHIEAWILGNKRRISAVADALKLEAKGSVAAIDPVGYVLQVLLPAIDRHAAAETGHADLSQRLAEAGLLPMFGFPTNVRYLYTQKPSKSYPWPPKGAIDRALPIAVSQFAPGAETVRDGWVHTAIGVGSYRPAGPGVVPIENPLGVVRAVGYCLSCGHLDDTVGASAPESAPEPCPACGDSDFNIVDMSEPEGFIAGKPKDFDGTFSWSSRSSVSRAAANLEQLAEKVTENMTVLSGPGRKYSINDNSGRLYKFQRPSASWSSWGGLINSDLVEEHPYLKGRLGSEPPLPGVALGSSQQTDLFLLGPAPGHSVANGLRLSLERAFQVGNLPEPVHGRRAAWISLATLLRRAACPHLDIQPNELVSGLYGSAGEVPVYAFMADTLDNGAGFCTHLASSSEELNAYLDAVCAYLEDLASPGHSSECNASCYECLRDYANMSAHALLDWRLARDLFTVLRGRPLNVEVDKHSGLLKAWADDTGCDFRATASGHVAVYNNDWGSGKKIAVITKHPLEASDGAAGPRLRQLLADAQSAVPGAAIVIAIDDFLLDRSPSTVTAHVEKVDDLIN
ncbi:Helicase conserved C-terminal domain-containing protein [Actinomadura meyerae]|uniref:Helicase conserved C-terminal domain-containing protein n=1 Tax=Actinomadura meyerae TaxID=240840 RepID=A0A239NZP7_9ACTN|nr:DEAD/DEAH box helicase [Actinomadura meyerae]SNT60305.1 Helicase conserved C-terminal domain-containing protein [Actinomadura meyerae]